MRYALATALAASAALWSTAAPAQDARYRVDIGPGDLTDALATLSAQTGISLVSEGPLPRIGVHGVHGRMTAPDALERMLRATRLRVVRIGPLTYRIARRQPHAGREPGRDQASPGVDIVVTARKQSEALSGVAAPVSVYAPGDDGAAGAHDVAGAIEGLVLTHLGAGHDRPFIRGVADSPFNGFSQSTVSVQVNDARITYDAPEPGLSLVDIARVEVLKGPQGPLYGTGALGGVYRIVTNRPVLGAVGGSWASGFSSVAGGGIGADAEAVVNLPLVDDRAAIRLVGYAAADPGWIRDTGGTRGANRSSTLGGRAALRIAPAPGWTVDLTGTAQSIGLRDSQYVDRDAEDLTRTVPIREPRDTRLRLAQATVAGPVGAVQLTVATGHAWQDQTDIYDASASAVALGVAGATAYRDRRAYRVFDQEVRLASAPGERFAWVAGASYLSATTQAAGDIAAGTGSWSPFFALHRRVTETALFLDGALPIVARIRGALGVRMFRSTTEDERREDLDQAANSKASIGVTPSASLSYEIASDQLVYARFGTAFRPGGIDATNTVTGRYDADEVRSLDLGARLRLAGGSLSLDGGLFRSAWSHVQSDYLQDDGLIATRNAGDADILGAEISADWRFAHGWRVNAGGTWQRPRLIRAADGGDLPADRRLPVVPDVSARIELARDVTLRGWRVSPYVAARFTGSSRLSFDEGLDRRMGAYAIARAGIVVAAGTVTARIDLDNLLDARADTFAFGNPFSVRSVRQFTPARPRTIRVSISRRF